MVILVFDERCTTNRREMTKLTTTPTSMFQMIERKNVRDMIAMSTHACILRAHKVMSAMLSLQQKGRRDPPPVVKNVVRCLSKEREDDKSNTVHKIRIIW